MGILYLWFYYLIIGTTLLIGKAIACKLLGIYHKHYQIGYSPSLFQFRLFDVTFSVGIIIPLPWLFKIYEIHNEEKRKPQPIWMRREHSFVKRLAGILGGLVLLYLVGTTLYGINFYSQDRTYLSAENAKENGIYVDSLGYELGFRNGDQIVQIEGKSFERFYDIKKIILLERAKRFSIIRKDSLQDLVIDSNKAIQEIISNNSELFYPVYAKYPLKIASVRSSSSAFDAGLQKGDEIITVNKDTVLYFRDFTSAIKTDDTNSVLLGIRRGNSNELIEKNVHKDPFGKFGIFIKETLPRTAEKKSVLESLNAGNHFISVYFKQMRMLFAGEEKVKQNGGFATIGNIFPEKMPFLKILSIVLLTYICIHIVPTPITDTRYMIALMIDQVIKLPKNAPNWIGWMVIVPMLLITSIMDLIRAFS